MPNIEIHGFNQEVSEELENEIFETFSDKPYADDIVVTAYNTSVRNREGEPRPFIRLVNSETRDNKEILERLEEFGLDIEVVKLEGFRQGAILLKEES